jgi:hypothetical protein
MDMENNQESLRQAWHAFCDTLKEAGNQVFRPEVPDTGLDRAEGIRYVSRLVNLGFDMFLEEADPYRPRILWGSTSKRKPMFLNPDQTYHSITIRGDLHYRLTGRVPDGYDLPTLLEVQAWSGNLFASRDTGDSGKSQNQMSLSLLEEEIDFDEKGNFTIVIGPDETPGNWLKTVPESNMILIRQYVTNWDRQAPWELDIQCLDEPPDNYRLTPERMEQAVKIVSLFTMGVTSRWLQWIDTYKKEGKVNQFPRWFDPYDEYAPKGIRYRTSRFEIEEGEALVLEFEKPDTPYWGVTLTNFWLEVIDWHRGERASLNNETAEVDDDGWVRVVVSHEDPGVVNWLPTQGHTVGMYTLRWARKYDWEPESGAHLVSLGEAKKKLEELRGFDA